MMPEIKLIRGDTESIKISFVKDGEEYIPKDLVAGDIFTFTVRNRFTEEVILIKKCIYPDLEIDLKHEDTKVLDPTAYRFDLEYRKEDTSIVKTLMIGILKVTKDVTYD